MFCHAVGFRANLRYDIEIYRVLNWSPNDEQFVPHVT